MAHPEWALKYKEKGMELRCIRGRYYLYRVSSVYDKTKKRAKKITGEFLGCITEEDGLIPTGTKRKKKQAAEKFCEVRSISCKEYAATEVLRNLSGDIVSELEFQFPNNWKEILVLAMNRLLHQSPLKNMQFSYEESFLSEEYMDLNLRANTLTSFMQRLGEDREAIASFMSKFVTGSEQLVFDITDVVSQSKKIKMSEKGYNSHYNFDPQVNLFYMFGVDVQSPVFYRIFPGNISGMKALSLSIKESGAKNVTVIGDKGFASNDNIEMLQEMDLNFILPLKRDSSYLDYQRLQSRLYDKAFDSHFLYHNRPIFYYTLPNYHLFITNQKPEARGAKPQGTYLYKADNKWHIDINDKTFEISGAHLLKALSDNALSEITITDTQISQASKVTNHSLMKLLKDFLRTKDIQGVNFDDKKKIVVFCDKRLQFEEENSYLSRIDTKTEGYSMESYKDKQLLFGTIGMITNMTDVHPQKIYENFKTRMEVETVFDAYKNLLEADRHHMQSDNSINAWMFINHIAVMMYYKLLNLIKSKNLISKISPSELLLKLSKINKVKINGEWYLAEINSKSMKMFGELGIHIT